MAVMVPTSLVKNIIQIHLTYFKMAILRAQINKETDNIIYAQVLKIQMGRHIPSTEVDDALLFMS